MSLKESLPCGAQCLAPFPCLWEHIQSSTCPKNTATYLRKLCGAAQHINFLSNSSAYAGGVQSGSAMPLLSAQCHSASSEIKQCLCLHSTALLYARCKRRLTILQRWLAKGPWPAAAKPTLFTGLFKVPSPSTLWLNVSSTTRAITRTPKPAAVGGSPIFSRPNAACSNHTSFLLNFRPDSSFWQRYTYMVSVEVRYSATYLSKGGAGKHKNKSCYEISQYVS